VQHHDALLLGNSRQRGQDQGDCGQNHLHSP
jgi:hypothetical protein